MRYSLIDSQLSFASRIQCNGNSQGDRGREPST